VSVVISIHASLREATKLKLDRVKRKYISIHASLREATVYVTNGVIVDVYLLSSANLLIRMKTHSVWHNWNLLNMKLSKSLGTSRTCQAINV